MEPGFAVAYCFSVGNISCCLTPASRTFSDYWADIPATQGFLLALVLDSCTGEALPFLVELFPFPFL